MDGRHTNAMTVTVFSILPQEEKKSKMVVLHMLLLKGWSLFGERIDPVPAKWSPWQLQQVKWSTIESLRYNFLFIITRADQQTK